MRYFRIDSSSTDAAYIIQTQDVSQTASMRRATHCPSFPFQLTHEVVWLPNCGKPFQESLAQMISARLRQAPTILSENHPHDIASMQESGKYHLA